MKKSKRIFDVCASCIGLIIAAPFLFISAIAIFVADGRPIFFRQKRIGKYGREFVLYKLRTMRTDINGPLVTGADDPRITRLGHILRKTKLDELPQLYNVLIGDMSFVGPRPDVERYLATISDDLKTILTLTPGITSPATIAYRNEEELLSGIQNREAYYIEHIMPDKIRLNLEYANRATFLTDLAVIMQTVIAVFTPSRPCRKAEVNLQ